MLRAMTDERLPQSSLKGRLADVYVPALVGGALDSLARRLGNRATIDDPLRGRAGSLASIEPLLASVSSYLRERGATYRHVRSTTGVDRDLCEGVLELEIGGEPRAVPIVVVAERRRLREIELRVYYAPPDAPAGTPPRAPIALPRDVLSLPQLVAHVLDALKKGAVERVLAAFDGTSRIVDVAGHAHAKRDGGMAAFVTELGAGVDLEPAGSADDGRTCGVEGMLAVGGREPTPAVLAFERGDTGLFHELRLYYA